MVVWYTCTCRDKAKKTCMSCACRLQRDTTCSGGYQSHISTSGLYKCSIFTSKHQSWMWNVEWCRTLSKDVKPVKRSLIVCDVWYDLPLIYSGHYMTCLSQSYPLHLLLTFLVLFYFMIDSLEISGKLNGDLKHKGVNCIWGNDSGGTSKSELQFWKVCEITSFCHWVQRHFCLS